MKYKSFFIEQTPNSTPMRCFDYYIIHEDEDPEDPSFFEYASSTEEAKQIVDRLVLEEEGGIMSEFPVLKKCEISGFDDLDGYAKELIHHTVQKMYMTIDNTKKSDLRKDELKKIFLDDFIFYLEEERRRNND